MVRTSHLVIPAIFLCVISENVGWNRYKDSSNNKVKREFNELLKSIVNLNQERLHTLNKLTRLENYNMALRSPDDVPSEKRSQKPIIAVILNEDSLTSKETSNELNNLRPKSIPIAALDAFVNENKNGSVEGDLMGEKTDVLRKFKGCNRKASKSCKRACVRAYKNVCSDYKCSRKMKKSYKRECKRTCRAEFMD